MSMQINVDPAGLTQAQREAVAGFILAYPAGQSLGNFSVDVTADTSKLKAAIAAVKISPDDVPNVGELTPVEVFGSDQSPVTAFGVPPVPNAPNASAPANALAPAPSTNLVPPPPPQAPQINGVDLDAQGLPWNAKIHAESKAKIADGTWRKKRGVDPALVATVEAELRQLMTAPAAPAAPPPIAVAIPAAIATALAPPPPIAAAPSVTEVGPDARQQYVSLIGRASAAVQAGKVTQAEITQCCAQFGVPALPLLANRLDLVATVAAQVDALIASRP